MKKPHQQASSDDKALDLLPPDLTEKRAAKPLGSIEDFIGCLSESDAVSLSITEINEIIAWSWAGGG